MFIMRNAGLEETQAGIKIARRNINNLRLSENGLPPPHFRQDARNKHSMLAMVKAGFGAAIVPESCCIEVTHPLTVRALDIPLPPVEIMAVWNKKNSAGTVRKFISLLPEFSENQ